MLSLDLNLHKASNVKIVDDVFLVKNFIAAISKLLQLSTFWIRHCRFFIASCFTERKSHFFDSLRRLSIAASSSFSLNVLVGTIDGDNGGVVGDFGGRGLSGMIVGEGKGLPKILSGDDDDSSIKEFCS